MDPNEREDDDESFEEKLEEMKREYPEYDEGSIRAALFIGIDYPYVPGDPDL